MNAHPDFQIGTMVTVTAGPASSPFESEGFTGRGIIRLVDHRGENCLIRLDRPESPALNDPRDGFGDTWVPFARVTPDAKPTTQLDIQVGHVDRHGVWQNARVTFTRGGCIIASAEYSDDVDPQYAELHSAAGTPPIPWATVEARLTDAFQAAASLAARKHRAA